MYVTASLGDALILHELSVSARQWLFFPVIACPTVHGAAESSRNPVESPPPGSGAPVKDP